MNSIFKIWDGIRGAYSDLNPSTLTGAIDVIVVQQKDASFSCGPFHVRFGKMGAIRPSDLNVDIYVNGHLVEDIHMRLGKAGEAFFLEKMPESSQSTQSIVDDLDKIYYIKESELRNSYSFFRNSRSASLENLSEIISLSNSNSNSDSLMRLPARKKNNPRNREMCGEEIVSDSEIEIGYDNIQKLQEFSRQSSQNISNDKPITNLVSCLSDSVLEVDSSSNINVPASGLSWEWGNIPLPSQENDNFNQIPPTIITNDDINNAVNCDSSQTLITITIDSDISNNSKSKSKEEKQEILLEDLIENSCCKKDYIYLPPSDNIFKTGKIQNLNLSTCSDTKRYFSDHRGFTESTSSLDDMMGSSTALTIDAGYKSDGEYSSSLISPPNLISYKRNSHFPLIQQLQFSLCGGLTYESQPSAEEFFKSLVTFDEFQKDPEKILNDSRLVVQLNEKMMPWPLAAPILVSILAFDSELPFATVQRLEETHVKPKTVRRRTWFTWRSTNTTTKIINNPASSSNICDVFNEDNNFVNSISPTNDTIECDNNNSNLSDSTSIKSSVEASDTNLISTTITTTTTTTTTCSDCSVINTNNDYVNVKHTSDRFMINNELCESLPASVEFEIITVSSEDLVEDSEKMSTKSDLRLDNNSNNFHKNKLIPFLKVTRLNSEQISKLNLNEGYNEIEYRVVTRWQGTAKCRAAIYYWKWYDRIVISDVDGTITRSDVWGQVMPLIGKDWSQLGVAKLYQNIELNGYRIVYLSARAIGQSEITRNYLHSVRQEENMNLPRGPILLSPNSLLNALHREVIEKKPEVFKIQCLEDLRTLFPYCNNPFYSGFGNRPNDVIAYKSIAIPDSRIFTVDPEGTIYSEDLPTRKMSFQQLTDLVDFIFPPKKSTPETGTDADPLLYSNFTFWRSSNI